MIPWDDPLANLTKFNNSIIGTNQRYELWEVDLRDGSTDKIIQHKITSPPHICDAKFLNCEFSRDYYFCHQDKIETSKG